MLVLTRNRDESIMIGDDVEITIVDIRGDKVRVGITAAKGIPVHRKEVYNAIQREKQIDQKDRQNNLPATLKTKLSDEVEKLINFIRSSNFDASTLKPWERQALLSYLGENKQ